MSVSLTVQDGIARIRLERPEAGNAMNPDVATGILRRATEIGERDDVRVIVLEASGKAFCVGGDLAYFASYDEDTIGGALEQLAGDLHDGLELLAEHDAPLVAMVQGVAAGAGMSLVASADIVLAAESASFTMAYTRVGLSPDGGSTWWLPRAVGWRTAAELMLTNALLDAHRAQDIGLVTRVVADDALAAEVDALAASLAVGPTKAYGAVTRMLRASAGRSLHDQLADETATIARLAGGPDAREGVAAFLAKRRPEFTGRG